MLTHWSQPLMRLIMIKINIEINLNCSSVEESVEAIQSSLSAIQANIRKATNPLVFTNKSSLAGYSRTFSGKSAWNFKFQAEKTVKND